MPRSIVLPIQYRVEFQFCDAPDCRALARCSRFIAAASIALAVSCVAIVTVAAPVPPTPVVTPRVTLFLGVLTPADSRAWMRSSLGIRQPHWIGEAR